MFVATITDDPLGLVLAIGVLVSGSSAVVYFTSRDKPAPPPSITRAAPGELMSASSTLARARAAANERSSAAASADGYRLTDVRSARPTPPAYPQRTQRTSWTTRSRRPAGQAPPQPDREEPDRTKATAQASALAFHIAEHDPQRMAEVIRSWIRSDMTKKAENS